MGKYGLTEGVDFERIESEPCVFNFVLERGDDERVGSLNHSSLSVNGMTTCSLGHGMTEGILDHEYFGSQEKVLADLKTMKGYETGLVEVTGGACLEKSLCDGLVYRMVQAKNSDAVMIPVSYTYSHDADDESEETMTSTP